MGRPPSNGGPAFRFLPGEVAEMESILQGCNNQMPGKEVLVALADKFSESADRKGKIAVQFKQVWNWFQNRRYAIRAKSSKPVGTLNVSSVSRDDSPSVRNVPQPSAATIPNTVIASVPAAMPTHSVPSGGRAASENSSMEFEAKSARDGAWYDVATFLAHRQLESGDPEVQVRFSGFGAEEDEWVNVRKHVRQRSLPCEASECVAVLPGDLILCFQEGKDQALYFDAHVLDAQRRRHDVRGCRCRFLVRYDHDQSEVHVRRVAFPVLLTLLYFTNGELSGTTSWSSEPFPEKMIVILDEIVPLRKICRRPETDYRLQQLHAATTDPASTADSSKATAPRGTGSTELPQKSPTLMPAVSHSSFSATVQNL